MNKTAHEINKPNSDIVISAKDLTKCFGSFTAVDHITFKVKKGEIFGFLGANGAGKTTAIRMLCGLSKPSAGEAWVAGYNVETDPEKVKARIGYMSQSFSLYEVLTVSQNIELFATIYGMTPQAIKQGMEQIFQALDMEKEKNTVVKSMPIGWKQKVAFAAATIHNPEIVFLDEPTGGVDPITRRKFWEQIYRVSSEGMTVFVTTHYLDEAEYCNRVSIMVDGKIAALDTPAGLKKDYDCQTMDEVFRKIALTAKRTD